MTKVILDWRAEARELLGSPSQPSTYQYSKNIKGVEQLLSPSMGRPINLPNWPHHHSHSTCDAMIQNKARIDKTVRSKLLDKESLIHQGRKGRQQVGQRKLQQLLLHPLRLFMLRIFVLEGSFKPLLWSRICFLFLCLSFPLGSLAVGSRGQHYWQKKKHSLFELGGMSPCMHKLEPWSLKQAKIVSCKCEQKIGMCVKEKQLTLKIPNRIRRPKKWN